MEACDRHFAGPVELLDERTLRGRVVPWGEQARIVELDDAGRPDQYREMFSRGAFDAQLTAQNPGVVRKVEFRDTHDGGLGKMGWCLDLVDSDDGLYGTFRLREANLDDVAQMIADGIDGLSVRFHPLRGGTQADRSGRDRLVTRTRAYLVHVALVPVPAYASARVLALRDSPDELLAEQDAADARTRELADLQAWLEVTHRAGLRWKPPTVDTGS